MCASQQARHVLHTSLMGGMPGSAGRMKPRQDLGASLSKIQTGNDDDCENRNALSLIPPSTKFNSTK